MRRRRRDVDPPALRHAPDGRPDGGPAPPVARGFCAATAGLAHFSCCCRPARSGGAEAAAGCSGEGAWPEAIRTSTGACCAACRACAYPKSPSRSQLGAPSSSSQPSELPADGSAAAAAAPAAAARCPAARCWQAIAPLRAGAAATGPLLMSSRVQASLGAAERRADGGALPPLPKLSRLRKSPLQGRMQKMCGATKVGVLHPAARQPEHTTHALVAAMAFHAGISFHKHTGADGGCPVAVCRLVLKIVASRDEGWRAFDAVRRRSALPGIIVLVPCTTRPPGSSSALITRQV